VVVDDSGESKRVCPECGMENPREANHCGDCGFSFGKEVEGDDVDE
jgi:ribosomal protein L40E